MLFILLLVGLFGNKGFMIFIKSINICKLCKYIVYLELIVLRFIYFLVFYIQLDNLYVKVLNCFILLFKFIYIYYYGLCVDIQMIVSNRFICSNYNVKMLMIFVSECFLCYKVF